jgi:predicted RNA-binding protein
VIPKVGLVEGPRPHRAKRLHLASGLAHEIPVLDGHEQRTEPVQQHVNGETGPTAVGQRLRHRARHRAVLVEVLRVGDRCARRPDGLQHRGKDLLSIEQDGDGIAAHDGCAPVGSKRRIEGRIAQLDVGERDVRSHARARRADHQNARDEAHHGPPRSFAHTPPPATNRMPITAALEARRAFTRAEWLSPSDWSLAPALLIHGGDRSNAVGLKARNTAISEEGRKWRFVLR